MNKKTNILECPFQKERNGNMHSFIDFRCSVHNSLIYESMIYLICSNTGKREIAAQLFSLLFGLLSISWALFPKACK